MAKGKLLKEKRAAEQRKDWREVATLCNALGGELQAEGDLQGALQQHHQEREACMQLNDTLGIGVSHRRIGEVLNELGNTEEALVHQNQHLKLAKEASSVLEQQRAYATIGRTLLDKALQSATTHHNTLDDAKQNFLHSLQKCKELPVGSVQPNELALMRCRLYLNLGLVADLKEDASTATLLITQASTLGRQYSFHEDLYRCHFALGTIYLKQKKFGLALEEAKHTMTISGKLTNFEKIESQKSVGRLCLIIGDLSEAKRAFNGAYKIAKSEKNNVSDLQLNIKTIVQLIKMKEIDSEDLIEEDNIKHLEKMGDLYAQIKCFDKAIECYRKVVDESLFLNKNEDDMAPIYYSIAQTYDENKQFEEARNYYRKEYDIRVKSEPGEACKTLLAIATVCENIGECYNDLKHYYNSAFDLAVKAAYPKLQLHVLRQQTAFEDIPSEDKEMIDENILRVIREHELSSDCELTDNEEEENENHINSDADLSESDEEYNDVSIKSRPNAVIVKNIHKTNQFGETALHKACIIGDLKKVKYLIKNGHSINVRDSAGWLPLHEASNHGHIEVVEFLLCSGAAMNDRGGKECNGITPLHDACSCGHWQIVTLLIKKGASVISMNDDGDTPIDSLRLFKERSSFDDEDFKEYQMVEKLLRNTMEKAGCQISSTAASAQSILRRPTNPNESLSKYDSDHGREDDFNIEDNDSSSSDENTDPVTVHPREKKAAIPLYKYAMDSLGSAATRSPALQDVDPSRVTRKPATKKAKTGLIEEKEFVGENDFIEDDLGLNSRKRKRPLPQAFSEFISNSNKERRLSSDIGISRKTPKIIPKRMKQTKLTTIMDSYSTSFANRTKDNANPDDVSDTNSTEIDFIEPLEIVMNKEHHASVSTDLTNHCSSSSDVSNVNTIVSTTNGLMRLRVKVEDKTLLVPIAENSREHSIDWLTGEVSRRYYQLTGIKPSITLQTSDGAILHPNDPITQVLAAEREELIASVTGWELPPLQQRYSQDCLYYKHTPCHLISQQLTTADSSGNLDLQRVTRNLAQLKLVFRAVQRHQNLHTLCLAHTKLMDEGFVSLLEVLPSLIGLSTINLQATGITKKSINDWTGKIDSNEFSKISLSNIDVSYNTLIGCTLSNIISLLSFTGISSLNLKHCHLDIQQICTIKTYKSLQILQLDFNTISLSPLKLLLSSVTSLKRLSLCGLQCPSDDGTNGISLALTNLLGGGQECALEHLDLSYTNLRPFDLDNIRAYLYRCSNLSSLSLANNDQLTQEAVTSLLEEMYSNFSLPLISLQLHGITNLDTDAFADSLMQMLHRKYNMQKPFQLLSFQCFSYSNLVIDTWQELFKDKSQINIMDSEIFLEVAR